MFPIFVLVTAPSLVPRKLVSRKLLIASWPEKNYVARVELASPMR